MSARTSSSDYDDDMKKAKAAGIDAFALNIAKDDYTDTQLGYAYESAAKNDMKVFISFDYNYFATGEDALVGAKIKAYADKPAQLKVGGKVFASSFVGDTATDHLLNAKAIRESAGVDVYLVPNLSPHNTATAASTVGDIDGAFNWNGWPSNGANRAPTASTNVSVAQGDKDYTTWLNGKPYLAPVSPWFFTHFGSKNWVMPGNSLWYDRWEEMLATPPAFIEILTWNDYGESHYIGPYGKHSDDGSGAWSASMPHDGWLDMAVPYIAAYKSGAKTPAITEDKLVYWYRPYPKAAGCSDSIGVPDGIDSFQDAVFVVAMLKEAGSLTVTSGSNTQTFKAAAGSHIYQVAMGEGKQTFSLARGSANVMSGTGSLEISNDCSKGVNFNAFVGVVSGGSGGGAAPTTTAASNTTAVPTQQTTAIETAQTTAIPSSSSTIITPGTKPLTTPTTTPTTVVTATPTLATPPTGTTATATTAADIKTKAAVGGCTATITASSQIFPTNCLSAGQAWAGSGDHPDHCDGVVPCQ